MRWFWIDRFEEFVGGDQAVAIKNVSLAEEHIHSYFVGHPVFPASLIIEGIAQTGGMLLGQMSNYESRLVLAKVSKSHFYFAPRPGDTLRYTAKIDNVGAEGALISGTSHVGDRLQGTVEFYLAILPERHEAEQLFDPAGFAKLLRVLQVYDVGRSDTGEPLEMPARFVEAERLEHAAVVRPLS